LRENGGHGNGRLASDSLKTDGIILTEVKTWIEAQVWPNALDLCLQATLVLCSPVVQLGA